MPTNPLWLEHTERAAWDTVKTLREEIVTERKRLERLTSLQPNLPKLSARLEQAATEHSLTAEDDVGRIDQLCEKLVAAAAESDRPGREAAEKEPPPVQAPPEDRRRWTPSVRWFANLIERRRDGRSEAVDPSRRARIVNALELRVEELATARKRELLELCVEVGCLALDLARIARRSSSE